MRVMTYQVTGLSKLKASMDRSMGGIIFWLVYSEVHHSAEDASPYPAHPISKESRGTATLQLLFLKLPYTYTVFLFMLYTP